MPTPPPTDTLYFTDEQFRAWLRKSTAQQEFTRAEAEDLLKKHDAQQDARTLQDFPPEEFDSWLTCYRAGRRSMPPLRPAAADSRRLDWLEAKVEALEKRLYDLEKQAATRQP
jgi:hypothetical protein